MVRHSQREAGGDGGKEGGRAIPFLSSCRDFLQSQDKIRRDKPSPFPPSLDPGRRSSGYQPSRVSHSSQPCRALPGPFRTSIFTRGNARFSSCTSASESPPSWRDSASSRRIPLRRCSAAPVREMRERTSVFRAGSIVRHSRPLALDAVWGSEIVRDGRKNYE